MGSQLVDLKLKTEPQFKVFQIRSSHTCIQLRRWPQTPLRTTDRTAETLRRTGCRIYDGDGPSASPAERTKRAGFWSIQYL